MSGAASSTLQRITRFLAPTTVSVTSHDAFAGESFIGKLTDCETTPGSHRPALAKPLIAGAESQEHLPGLVTAAENFSIPPPAANWRTVTCPAGPPTAEADVALTSSERLRTITTGTVSTEARASRRRIN